MIISIFITPTTTTKYCYILLRKKAA